MEGFKVRGRYPLTSIWLLAEWRGDIKTKTKVINITLAIAEGRPYQHATWAYELWLEEYASGVLD